MFRRGMPFGYFSPDQSLITYHFQTFPTVGLDQIHIAVDLRLQTIANSQLDLLAMTARGLKIYTNQDHGQSFLVSLRRQQSAVLRSRRDLHI